ncbi:hypothetical protein [Streptomyces griseus]|uniref:hypothetical protein n=1 Tax=Streptomyces griseus TaxID=1911 RepID=UPI0033B8EC41
MTTYQFDGHRFATQSVLTHGEDGPERVGLAAECSCGWRGADGDPGMEGKSGYRGASCHPISLTDEGESEAEQAAEQEWLDEHIANFSGPSSRRP